MRAVFGLCVAIVVLSAGACSPPQPIPHTSETVRYGEADTAPPASPPASVPVVTRTVHASAYGDAWPWRASEAELACEGGAVTVRLNGGMRFALNQEAERAGWPSETEFDTMRPGATFQGISALIREGEALC